MDIDRLAKKLSQMHIGNARLLTQFTNFLSASSIIGVLLRLKRHDNYATDIIEQIGLIPSLAAKYQNTLKNGNLADR